jgi:hypothetical protein
MTRPDEHLHHWDQESHTFEQLYPLIEQILERFGRPNYLPQQPRGDFTVHGDYLGYPEVVVFVSNLEMLRPPIIAALQELIKSFPGWQITMTIAMRGHYDDWPHMGLYIRPHEIIDGLQRQYFPEEFQSLEYGGARRGGAHD